MEDIQTATDDAIEEKAEETTENEENTTEDTATTPSAE